MVDGADGRLSYPRWYAGYLSKLLGPVSKREAIFFSVLGNTRRGVVACVFESAGEVDRIVGETLAHVDAATGLFVLSAHRVRASGRRMNINAWLEREGYGARACQSGLTGIRLNREIVSIEEARSLKIELAARLTGLVDEETGQIAIQHVYQASDIYRGPYMSAAPDLVIGYSAGYGCVDASLAPGVLFSNLKISADSPSLGDLAPTALGLFGVEAPAWMEGRSIIAAA